MLARSPALAAPWSVCLRAAVWLLLPVLSLARSREMPVEVPIVLQIQETARVSSFMTQLRNKRKKRCRYSLKSQCKQSLIIMTAIKPCTMTRLGAAPTLAELSGSESRFCEQQTWVNCRRCAREGTVHWAALGALLFQAPCLLAVQVGRDPSLWLPGLGDGAQAGFG